MPKAIPSFDFLKAHWLKLLVTFVVVLLFILPAILKMLAEKAAKNPDGFAKKVVDAVPVTPKA